MRIIRRQSLASVSRAALSSAIGVGLALVVSAPAALASASFSPGVSLSAPEGTNELLSLDLDGDGHQDLVGYVGNFNSTKGSFFSVLGDGKGSFGSLHSIAIGGEGSLSERSMEAGDFNEDGFPDIALIVGHGSSPAQIQVYIGDGHGGFGLQTVVGAGSEPPVVGDFDKDGHQDIAALVQGGVAVYLGDGHGGFTATATGPSTEPGPTSPGVPTSLAGLTSADFNGDGRSDLALLVSTHYQGPTTVDVLLASSAGGFEAPIGLPTCDFARFLSTGDFNQDGKQDIGLVGCGTNGPAVAIYRGAGNGRFGSPTLFPSGDGAYALSVGDITGDGFPDLVVSTSANSRVWVVPNNATGAFSAPIDTGKSYNAGAVAVADFNEDAKQDLAIPSSQGGVQILINTTLPPGASPVPVFTWSSPPVALQPVTFDASASSDADGTIASYGWSFGDGSAVASGRQPTHVFAAAGAYNVSLAVTDDRGNTATTTQVVSVAAPPTQTTSVPITPPGPAAEEPAGSAPDVAPSSPAPQLSKPSDRATSVTPPKLTCVVPKLIKNNQDHATDAMIGSQHCTAGPLISTKGVKVKIPPKGKIYVTRGLLISRTLARTFKLSTSKPVGKNYVQIKAGVKLPAWTVISQEVAVKPAPNSK